MPVPKPAAASEPSAADVADVAAPTDVNGAADRAGLAALVPFWPEAALLTSADGTILAANDDARTLAGLPQGSLDCTIASLFGASAWAALVGPQRVADAQRDGGHMLRLRASPAHDGSWLLSLTGTPTGTGTGTGASADERLRSHIDQAERLASIGELLSSVAHELNNPLTSVLGFAEILLADDAPSLPRSEIECIRDEAERCRRIVKNLLDLARAEELQMQPLLLQDVVRKVEEFRAYATQARGIELLTEIDADLPFVEGDFHRLVQATLNLATNAEYAVSERDGVRRIVLRAHRAGTRLAIEVEDNGPGIPVESRERIFEPFFTTKPRGRGTGLGLSLVRATAAAHGGAVRVERATSGGARFVLELPIASGAPL